MEHLLPPHPVRKPGFVGALTQDWPVIQAHPREVMRQLAVGTPLAAAGSQLTAKWARAKVVDAAILAVAIGLLAALASWTTSPIFTAMIAGLLLMQAAAAYELRWPRGAD